MDIKNLMKFFAKHDDVLEVQDVYNFKQGNYEQIIDRLNEEYKQIEDKKEKQKYLDVINKLKDLIEDHKQNAYRYDYKYCSSFQEYKYWFNFYLDQKLVGEAQKALNDIKSLDDVDKKKVDKLQTKLEKYKKKYEKQIEQIQEHKEKRQKIRQVKSMIEDGETSKAMSKCLKLLDEYPNDNEIKKLRDHIDYEKKRADEYNPEDAAEKQRKKSYFSEINSLKDENKKELTKQDREKIYERLDKMKKEENYREALRYISDLRREQDKKDLKLMEYYKEFSQLLEEKKKKQQKKKFELECKTVKMKMKNKQYDKALKKINNILQHYPLINKDKVYKLLEKVKKEKEKDKGSDIDLDKGQSDLEKRLGKKFSLSRKALNKFFDKVSWFLKSEMDIKIALRTVYYQVDDLALKEFLKDLIEGLESGRKISDVMNGYKEIDNFSKALIRIGENTGQLGDMFELINQSRKEAEKRRKKIKNVMMYPAIVISITILIFVGLLIFIIPKFVGFYEDVGVELPTLTKGVLAISDFVRYKWYIIILALVVIGVGLKMLGKTEKGKRLYSRLTLNTIVVKEIVHRKYIVFFTGKLALLLGSGVNLLNAFDMLIYGADNILFREELLRIKYEVQSGVSIAEAIGLVDVSDIDVYNNPYIPINVAYSIDIGEQSGQLDEVLRDIEQIYDEELHHIINNLQSLMEPVIIFILGILVALFVASIFLPMIGMYNALGEMGGV